MNSINEHTLYLSASIKDALVKINSLTDSLTLFVINKNRELQGTLTDGDIRRGLIKGFQLSDTIDNIMLEDFKYIINSPDPIEIKDIKELLEIVR